MIEVHTSQSAPSPISSQALLSVTLLADQSAVITAYGTGNAREMIDALIETLRDAMRQDSTFKFKS